MTLKRFFFAILAFLLSCSLIGCGGPTPSISQGTASTPQASSATTSPPVEKTAILAKDGDFLYQVVIPLDADAATLRASDRICVALQTTAVTPADAAGDLPKIYVGRVDVTASSTPPRLSLTQWIFRCA